MIPTIIIISCIFVALILSIIFLPTIKIGKISLSTYWIIPLVGAIILLIFGLVDFPSIGQSLTSDSEINPLKILLLFFSMTFISIFLDEIGFFRFIAEKAIKHASTSQLKLFIILYVLVSLLTVFTSNDIVILTFTPIICYFAKNAKINPLPFLIGEFVAANTWSMLFIIGNPTNIYLATSARIDFISYFKVMGFPTLACGIVELVILLLLFRKPLKQPIGLIDNSLVQMNRLDVIIGVSDLFVCLVLLIVSSYVEEVQMWLAACICAGALLIYVIIKSLINHNKMALFVGSIKRLPWALIPFFISMFVVTLAISKQGIASELQKFLSQGQEIITYGYASFISSNLMNNIPMSILFSSIPDASSSYYLKATYASIIGSNLGAFLTPVGALAGIMFSNLLKKHEIKFSMLDFIKYGAIISIPCITVALFTLILVFC